jgi:hypothetical protein
MSAIADSGPSRGGYRKGAIHPLRTLDGLGRKRLSNHPLSKTIRAPDENLMLRQIDQARTDFASIETDLEFRCGGSISCVWVWLTIRTLTSTSASQPAQVLPGSVGRQRLVHLVIEFGADPIVVDQRQLDVGRGG